MKRFWGCLGLGGLLLTGCGGGPAVQSTPPADKAALLAGNWLLAGSLQAFPGSLSSTPSFSLTATFGGFGDEVLGAPTYFVNCVNSGGGGSGGGLSGTIAEDGSFTLTSPTNTEHPLETTITIAGKVPDVAGAPWSGTYTFNNPQGCGKALTGSISAQPLPLINGTYQGISYTTTDIGKIHPITFAVVLAQSTASGRVASGGFPADAQVSGTLSVQGASCFTSGTTNGFTDYVAGNYVGSVFHMNDGTLLTFEGSLTKSDESALTVSFRPFQQGTCGDLFPGFVMERQ